MAENAQWCRLLAGPWGRAGKDRGEVSRRKIQWYGERLKSLRERAGLTQAELGKRIGARQSHVHRLEIGEREPTLATAVAIARAIGCDIKEFVPDGAKVEVRLEADELAARPKRRSRKPPSPPSTP